MNQFIDNSTMDKICAVIDVQGFQFPDRFVAREIAIASDNVSQCQELNPLFNWRDLPDEEQAIVLHSTRFKHGLHYCPFNPVEHAFLYASDEVNKLISTWYEMIATDDKPYFAFKNHQMGKILRDMGIPCYDLDFPESNFPSYEKIQQLFGDNYLCSYHKKPKRNSNIKLVCAYRKANQLYRYFKEEISPNMDWDNM